MRNLTAVIILVILTACEAAPGTPLATPGATSTPAASPTIQTESSSISTPAIAHTWVTTNIPWDNPQSPGRANPMIPQNQLLGSYLGSNTNGPIFTLDFSSLKNGLNIDVKIPINSTHSCYYDITLSDSFYNVNTLASCNDDVSGIRDNIHCEYCPYNNSGSYNNLNWIFDYSISNGHLTLTDTVSTQSETYSIKN